MNKLEEKEIKIYADGVFDLTHYGHFNALKQAKAKGNCLYVGVISDEEVKKAKGMYPIFPHYERVKIIQACRWVDDIIPMAPYDVTLEYFNSLGCDYVAHGDDLALNENGKDCYEQVRTANLLAIFKRTEGVSTTQMIIDLLQDKSNYKYPLKYIVEPVCLKDYIMMNSIYPLCENYFDPILNFDKTDCGKRKKTIYLCGSFTILHVGHVSLFEEIKQLGHHVVVGLITSEAPQKSPKEVNYSILHRSATLAALKYVDDIIINVPLHVDEAFMKKFDIDIIAVESSFNNNLTLYEQQLLKDNRLIIYPKEKYYKEVNNDAIKNRILNFKIMDESVFNYRLSKNIGDNNNFCHKSLINIKL